MSGSKLKKSFGKAALQPGAKQPRRNQKPFSIRFDDHERALLDRGSGKLSWAAYIRQRLFGDCVDPKRLKSGKRREHSVDKVALAKALGLLGQSRLSSNLNQIARAANIGTLPVTPELVEELHEACTDVRAMRNALMSALGLKPKDDTE